MLVISELENCDQWWSDQIKSVNELISILFFFSIDKKKWTSFQIVSTKYILQIMISFNLIKTLKFDLIQVRMQIKMRRWLAILA